MIWLVHELLTGSPARQSAKQCLIYRGKTFSYAQLEQDVRALAGVLQHVGLRPGGRVAIYFEKSVEEVVSMLAVSLAGGIFVNVNTLLKAKQVSHILADSGASVLITSSPRLKNLAGELDHLSNLQVVIASGLDASTNLENSARRQTLNMQAALKEMKSLVSPVRRIDSDPAGIIYTSGSTGMPKGVVVSHRNVVAGAQSVASYLRSNESDRILSILPFSFDYGLNQLTTCLLVGATLVLRNYLTSHDILNTMEQEKITGLAGIPTIWSQLLQLDWSHERFPHLRYITNSGGRFPERLVKEYRRRLPQTQIYLMYGLTEAFRSTYLEPEQVDTRPTSIGKAIPGAEILVLNEEGKPCLPGQVGQLVHRGVHVSLGYWNDPVRTRERFYPNHLQPAELQMDEWLVYSGDLVKQDQEGYLYYIGRNDNMIKTSGFRVSPTEVEEHFYSTEKVRDAVAFGVPDEMLGESIVVVLSLRNGEDLAPEQILGLVSKTMPSYMVPKEVRIRQELPRNSNGKIDRVEIYRCELESRIAK